MMALARCDTVAVAAMIVKFADAANHWLAVDLLASRSEPCGS